VGALYFDTTLGEMRVYDGSVWKAAGSTVNGTAVRQTFTATAGQTTFAITGGYDAGFADVYLNGVKLVNGVDVDVTSGTDVVLTVGAAAGDSVDVIAYGAFVIANTYTIAQADALLADKASLTGTETLTNKTLTSPTLTTPNIDSAQVATVSGTAPLYMCRAWVNFDGTTATPSTIRGSGNVSSVTKSGTGSYIVNFVTALSDANYSCLVTRRFDGTNGISQLNSLTSVALSLFTQNLSGTIADSDTVCCSIFR
jgi:hypothetical protein